MRMDRAAEVEAEPPTFAPAAKHQAGAAVAATFRAEIRASMKELSAIVRIDSCSVRMLRWRDRQAPSLLSFRVTNRMNFGGAKIDYPSRRSKLPG